jgi:hypothetical protein
MKSWREARDAAIDWYCHEIEFATDAGEWTDDIEREVRAIVGGAPDRSDMFGVSILGIQQAAAYIAGQRHAAHLIGGAA